MSRPEQKRDLRGPLLKVVGGSLFSVTFGLYFFLAVKFAGVNLATLPPLDVIGIFGIFFWVTTLSTMLIGRLPMKAVAVIFVVAVTFSAISMFFFLKDAFHLSILIAGTFFTVEP